MYDAFVSAIFCITVFLLAVKSLNRRTKLRIFIPDYQRGVHFVKGVFVDVLGPGAYSIAKRSEQVEFVDLRPQQVVLDKTTYLDALQNTAMVSIGAELAVSDPRLAAAMIKGRPDDLVSMIRDIVRSVLSRAIVDRSISARNQMTADLTAGINDALAQMGITISRLEILELWSQFDIGRSSTVSH